MISPRLLTVSGITLGAVMLLAGCSLVQGPADRTDQFVAAGKDCSGSWWLGDLREGTDDEAQRIAEEALTNAVVTPDALSAAISLLDDSKNDAERQRTSAVDLESEAYMLTVTLQVKDELDAAGYPDSDRVIEVWSDRQCS